MTGLKLMYFWFRKFVDFDKIHRFQNLNRLISILNPSKDFIRIRRFQ